MLMSYVSESYKTGCREVLFICFEQITQLFRQHLLNVFKQYGEYLTKMNKYHI